MEVAKEKASELYIDFIKLFRDDVKFEGPAKFSGRMVNDGKEIESITLAPVLVQTLFNSIVDDYIESYTNSLKKKDK